MKRVMKEMAGLGIVMVLVILVPAAVVEAMTGSGTEQDPYIIYDVNDLQAMNNDLDAWYELSDDIDASATSGWNAGAGFLPIGDYPNYFTGHFDGKDYRITDLYINRPSKDFVGLFGYTYVESEIKNVGLTNVDITGSGGPFDSVGALVGINTASISRCYSTGSVVAAGSGGGSIIRGAGGLVGYHTGGANISDSYSTASVSGNIVGGLVGYLDFATFITNSYSTGSVIGEDEVGGLIGLSSGSCNNCFWDIETSDQTTSACGIGKTTAEMKQKATFTNWDFDNIWDIIEDETYPLLRGLGEKWAVIVGVGDYIDPNIGPLDYAANDANEIYNRLIDSGWIPEHIKLLTDNQATKENIEAAVDWMSTHAIANDICFFYFSGYGTYSTDDLPPDVEADGHDEFICPVDTEIGSPESAICDDELATWTYSILAHKIIMLDACRSGGFINDLEGPGIYGIGCLRGR